MCIRDRYRRYASLFFVVGAVGEENELGMLEFIHAVVETLDKHFGNVCELDIMMHLDKVYCILEEMVMCGNVVEMNKPTVIAEACKSIDVVSADFQSEMKRGRGVL